LIIDRKTSSCILIDPGSFNGNDKLETFIQSNNLKINYVIITHEHFDHIAGVNALMSTFEFELICSELTAKALIDTKMNLSAFNDQLEPVVILHVPKIIHNGDELLFANKTLRFFYTPGHSPGSMCITFDDCFFSGDTLLQIHKPRLNLPGSNKDQYKITLEKLKIILKDGMCIYPGHGDTYFYNTDKN
jgi:glyoxylase-like metal-dependent hydrolase (beta-lactamase superfamily II)